MIKRKWTYYARSLGLYITFGFAATSAGMSFTDHPVAYAIAILTIIFIGLNEFDDGLTLGSEVANKIWRSKFDGAVERVLSKVS